MTLPGRRERSGRILHVANPATTRDPAVGPLRTFCGRPTDAITFWASPELTDRSDFLPTRRRCAVCEGRKR